MRGQLEYCDLDEWILFQVKIVEYDSFEDYKKDVMLTTMIVSNVGIQVMPPLGPIVTSSSKRT